MAKLTEPQRERLWHIMKGAGCLDEWLMAWGEYLCDNVASLIEREPVRSGPVPNSVTHHYNPPPASDFGVGLAIGLVTGSMFG